MLTDRILLGLIFPVSVESDNFPLCISRPPENTTIKAGLANISARLGVHLVMILLCVVSRVAGTVTFVETALSPWDGLVCAKDALQTTSITKNKKHLLIILKLAYPNINKPALTYLTLSYE